MKTLITFLLFGLSCSIYAQINTFYISQFEKDKHLSNRNHIAMSYPGDENIDVKFYKLDLSITTSPNNLKGKVLVRFVLLDSVSTFSLDFTNTLSVDTLLLNNIQIPFSHSEDKLVIDIGTLHLPGEVFDAFISYYGVPEPTGFGSFNFGNHSGVPAIYTLSEPYGAKDWFPCKDSPSDKADSSEVWVTCNNDLYAVSNGVLVDQINNGNGTVTYKWKNRYPIAHYLMSIAVTNYTVYTTWYKYGINDSMPVIHYVYPENFNSVKEMLDKTPWFIKVFTDAFGEYPFIEEKYGQAQFGIGGGMEHQTVSSLGSFDEGLLVHELAHQWFGDKITCRNWHHIWLNEGFATFLSAYYFGETYGPQVYKNIISQYMSNSRTARGSIYVQDITSLGEIFNGARSYSKGAVVLHMLRGIVGDNKFFQLMKTYANDPSLSFGAAVTDDFKSIAESVSGMDLTYFFNEWIYGENYPKYNLSWDYVSEGSQKYLIKLKLTQHVNSSPQFFIMPFEVKVSTTLKDTLFRFLNDQMVQEFTIQVQGQPTDLIFDPNNFILKEVMISEIPENLIPGDYRLKQNFPNPFNSTTRLEFTTPRRDFINLSIFDLLGNKIAELLNQEMEAGFHEYNFSLMGSNTNLSSGVYYYRLSSENAVITRKMIILK